MHSIEITNAYSKMGKGTCVSLAFFEDHDVPLLSTKHVALRTNYSTEIAHHKQTIQTQSNKSNNWKGLFNNLDLLRCYDKKYMVKDHDLWDMDRRA
jgi:hypothetical protein